jgi:hypothetical protein
MGGSIVSSLISPRLDLLPERIFDSTWDDPFRFTGVTDRVSGGPEAPSRARPSGGAP